LLFGLTGTVGANRMDGAMGTNIKRIAVVTEDVSYPLDEGFKKASVRIAASLSRRIEEVTVFTPEAPDLEMPTRGLPRNKLLLGRGFAHALWASDPDVILYIPQSAATPMSLLRARLLKNHVGSRPVVVVSLQMRSYPGLVQPILRALKPDLVLVLSTASLKIMERAGIRARRIPLGVDTQVFRPAGPGEKEALRKKHGIGDGKIILHVGHISRRRNLDLLRRIGGEAARLLLVTSTSTIQDRRVAEALKDPGILLIDHYIEHIDEVYRLADGYVFPTFNQKGAIEIPLSVLEAMATNMPVTTTAFGGIPDLFDEGEGLFICSREADFIRRSQEMLNLTSVGTRDMVKDLAWDRVALKILETMEQELG
jgi:glycosyltransferase involved in cell wall biosynthesis